MTSVASSGSGLRSDALGAGVMLGVAFLFAFVLLGVAQAGQVPVFYLAFWTRLGIFFLVSVVFLTFYGRLLSEPAVLRFLVRRLWSWEVLLISASYLDFALMSLSFRFAEAQVVVVIFEVWPLFLIFIVSAFSGRFYDSVSLLSYLGLSTAFCGVLLVLSSGAGGPVVFLSALLSGDWRETALSVAFPLGAALLTSMTGFSWVWWARSSSESVTKRPVPPALAGGRGQAPALLWCLAFCCLFCAVASFLLGLVFHPGEPVVSGRLLLYGFVVAGFGYGLAASLWRYATTLTRNVGVHAVSYLTPVFALPLLAVFGLLSELSVWPLALGVFLVVGSNLSVSVRGFWGWLRLNLILVSCPFASTVFGLFGFLL